MEQINSKLFKKILFEITDTILREENTLTKLDAECGDGDFGVGMRTGFKNAKESIEKYEGDDIGSVLEKMGYAIYSSVGGASGPLFGAIFTEAGKTVKGKNKITLEDFSTMFEASLRKVYEYGKAKKGDKTLVDALEPAVRTLKDDSNKKLSVTKAFQNATKAARDGVESTRNLVAKKGKASYLGEKTLGHEDPGAYAIYLIFKSISSALESFSG